MFKNISKYKDSNLWMLNWRTKNTLHDCNFEFTFIFTNINQWKKNTVMDDCPYPKIIVLAYTSHIVLLGLFNNLDFLSSCVVVFIAPLHCIDIFSLKGGGTIFNMLTISLVGVGIGRKMFTKHFKTSEVPRKSNFHYFRIEISLRFGVPNNQISLH